MRSTRAPEQPLASRFAEPTRISVQCPFFRRSVHVQMHWAQQAQGWSGSSEAYPFDHSAEIAATGGR